MIQSLFSACWMGVFVLLQLSFAEKLSAYIEPLPSQQATANRSGGDDNPDVLEAGTGLSLEELVSLGLEQNPKLSVASYAIDAARGRAAQAGLFPNPTVGVTFDELGDKTGRSGVNTLPLISQEIVTGGKLRLSQAAGQQEVEQVSWRYMVQRYELLANIRTTYFDALTLQERIEILRKMVALADKSVSQVDDLVDAKQAARLDLVQLEVEAERLRAEFESAERELPATYKRLAAVVGVNQLELTSVDGSLTDPLPEYDLELVQESILENHPELQAALFGVERARLLLRRAKVEPVPNLNIDTGYVRQNQNRSDDFRIGASVSIPLWNRNQGNIFATQAQLSEAIQSVNQIENELTERAALAMRDYVSARRRAARYRDAILPRAQETYQLSREAYQGGQFEYLRVLEAQRAVAQASLEYVRSLGEAWKAAAVISGLTLEDEWPSVSPELPPTPNNVP
ncbi:MAG: TolC family protein [Planctomycetaceae bacterium]